MVDGQRVTFPGEGDQAPDVIPGDIVIVIEEKPHDFFTRKGEDLYCNIKLELVTALCGGQFQITHLDGRVLLISILPGEVINPGAVKVVNNEGMPQYFFH
jgi:DnaJ family protein A protein 2